MYKGGFSLGGIINEFTSKYAGVRIDISLSSEIFLLKIVKMILTNLRRKYLPHFLGQIKTRFISFARKNISIKLNQGWL